MKMKNSKRNKIPNHIGIIVDGNRRWAKEKKLPTSAGHKKGAGRIEEIVRYARELGVKIISIYAFSTENWKREEEEVSYLMKLFDIYAKNKKEEANDLGIQVRVIGNFQGLPDFLQETLSELIAFTKNNERMIVNLAINYGGRDELVRAFRKIHDAITSSLEISEDLININLDTRGLPDPDLIIRTSGEQRLSNFLPWQATYAELYFPKIHWPDFDKEQLDIALNEFQVRQKRMGK